MKGAHHIVVLAAHGSPDPRHAATLEELRGRVALRLGEVRLGWLGHHPPSLDAVVAEAVASDAETVVAPLLLAPAFHARVDIPANSFGARIADVLAPDDRLIDALDAQLVGQLDRNPDALILAAAGSTDPDADQLVRRIAALWSEQRKVPVDVGYVSAQPGIADTVASLAGHGVASIAVAPFLLAPGRLHDAVVAAANVPEVMAVGRPLGEHPAIVDIVCDRVAEARSSALLV